MAADDLKAEPMWPNPYFPPLDLAAIQARANAATEGPWFLDADGVGMAFAGNRADGRQYGLWDIVHVSADKLGDLKPECADQERANADFIAHARADVPALIAALRQVEAERDDFKARLIEAADALSPAVGAMVGGRGVAMAAKQVVAERNRALGELDELKDAMLRAMGTES